VVADAGTIESGRIPMKIRAGIIVLLAAAALARPIAAQSKLKVEKLADGVWAAQPEKGANVGWFLLGDGVVAVDSGADTATAQEILKSIAETAGKPVRYLILTHSHGDHSRGARAFAAAGAVVICQQNVAGTILALVTQAATEPGDPLAGKPGLRPVVESVGDRSFLLDGVHTAEIDFLGSGHTSGDLIVYLPSDKVLFAGDLASNGRLPDLKSIDVDPSGWERALQNLSRVNVQKMVPGHGQIGPVAGLADSLAYVHRVNELAKKFVDSGTRDEMLDSQIRAPENSIPNVSVSDAHVANVKAAVRVAREKATRKPTLTAIPVSPTPVK
jgi:glyoxylase-like metal-dependent hydrolase (beta-lactamase superfamily II)